MKERGIEAADYDRQQGTELVDRAKTEGDAVAPASADDEGRLVYRACDFGDGVRALAFQVSGRGVSPSARPGTTP